MTAIIRLSVKIPKAVASLMNGLEVHVPDIAEHVRDAAAGDPWTGYIVAQVESVEGGRTSGSGEPTADVIITAVELMEGDRQRTVQELFAVTRAERLAGGSLVDPEVVGDDDPDDELVSTWAQPDAPTYDGMREGERVGLEQPTDPADFRQRVGAKAAAERLAADWSPADDASAS